MDIYSKNTWVDEVLAGDERYNILTDGGTIIESNVQIELDTTVSIAGSQVSAARMNNIESGIEANNLEILKLQLMVNMPNMPGRLSLSSTDAAPVSDLTGVANLYFPLTQRHGRYVALYKGGYWRGYDASSVPALSSASLAHDSVHDVFMHADSDSPAMEFNAWTQPSGPVTGATNATPIVITSAGHGLVNGDIVAVRNVGGNTAANNVHIVANKTTDTFELSASVGSGAYTSGGTWRKQNLSEPTRGTQSGFVVKNGDPTRRWIGTVYADAAGGTISDMINRRGVWNAYNQVIRLLETYNSNSSWTYDQTTAREYNAGTGQVRGWFVIGKRGAPHYYLRESDLGFSFYGGAGGNFGTTLNSVSAHLLSRWYGGASHLLGRFGEQASGYIYGKIAYRPIVSAGPNFITQIEAANASGSAFTNTGGQDNSGQVELWM